VKVHRSAARIAGIAGIADHRPRIDTIAGAYCRIAIQVRVIVPLESGPEDPHHPAAEPIGADARHQAAGGAEHGRILHHKDVDSLMVAPSGASVSPRINESGTARRGQRVGQRGWRLLRRERVDEPGALDVWLRHRNDDPHDERANHGANQIFHADVSGYGPATPVASTSASPFLGGTIRPKRTPARERADAAIRAGIASVLNNLTGVIWLD
jgi:hypothetical protein